MRGFLESVDVRRRRRRRRRRKAVKNILALRLEKLWRGLRVHEMEEELANTDKRREENRFTYVILKMDRDKK